MPIPKIYKHGIEITKPWSTEMYDYNNEVREYMIKEIKKCINSLEDKDTANQLARIINPSTYGDGFDIVEIKADLLNNAEHYENYWLAEIWDDLIDSDWVLPKFTGTGNEVNHIIGFESKEEILELRAKFSNLKK
tara:strand:+ start:60 stop:464 length:405 start_codon:yes stop_codon:yes gene_type:complete